MTPDEITYRIRRLEFVALELQLMSGIPLGIGVNMATAPPNTRVPYYDNSNPINWEQDQINIQPRKCGIFHMGFCTKDKT